MSRPDSADVQQSAGNPKTKESAYKCPRCGASCEVVRTKATATEIFRERRCAMGHKFGTKEEATDAEFQVKRRDGKVQPFERKFALEHSILLAGAGGLSERDAAVVAERVFRRLDPQKRTPVDTRLIGEAVIDELRRTSEIAALRYAATFLSSRDDSLTPAAFLSWAEERFRPLNAHSTVEERPHYVIKRPRVNRNPGYGEDFQLAKLWKAFSTATRRLKVTVPDGTSLTADELSGVLSAYALSTVRGQKVVTSSQLSSAALEILRSVCPLGYLRFTAVAKGYTSKGDFLDEVRGLIEYKSPLIDLTPFLEAGKAIATEVHLNEV